MIDVQLLRMNITQVAHQLKNKGYHLDNSLFIKLEEQRKQLQTETQNLQSQRNIISKEIGIKKSKKEDISDLMKQVSTINDQLNSIQQNFKKVQTELESWLLSIPNIPNESVPLGKDENDNIQIRTYGTPKIFDFNIKDQVELGETLGLDINAGTKLSGSRFSVLKGSIARLHRALAQFMIDLHTEQHGYTEHYTPYIVNPDILYGTGQLPKFAQDMYQVISGDTESEQKSQYLISTSEITLTNTFREKIVDGQQLPFKMTAHSPCFRSEAGSHGKDTKGLIRQHQFDKVEMVQITHPDKSYEALEEMVSHAEAVLQALELPYRVVILCTGDMGFSAAKTYDLEVWIPSENTYREISSCSNCEDFQARRMKARFKDENGKNKLVHTLNGSGVAVGRALVAVLENHQNQDGSIYIPEKLRPYINGLSKISQDTQFTTLK
ncbi:MAG: serine--tRNA ligase [Neisseriaceae bacterium]|nr:MAG: serine--tRNA ligase [Neisseriaceae bacterium]